MQGSEVYPCPLSGVRLGPRSPLLKNTPRAQSKAVAEGEFQCVSIDATVRVAMTLKGQANYRASKAKKASAVLPESQARRTVLTVRGRTGAVVGMWLVKSEKAMDFSDALSAYFPHAYRQQVATFFSDDPSARLFTDLKGIFLCLEFLCLDPVHLVIVYVQSHLRKRTPGSQYLRLIMNKINKTNEIFHPGTWGAPYRGVGDVDLSHAEQCT